LLDEINEIVVVRRKKYLEKFGFRFEMWGIGERERIK